MLSILIIASAVVSAAPPSNGPGTEQWCRQLEEVGALGPLIPLEEAASSLAGHAVLGKLLRGADLASAMTDQQSGGTRNVYVVVGFERTDEVAIPVALGRAVEGELRIRPVFSEKEKGSWCVYIKEITTSDGASDIEVKLPAVELVITAKLNHAAFAEKRLAATSLRFFRHVTPEPGESLVASGREDSVFVSIGPNWKDDEREPLCGVLFDLFAKVPRELACPASTTKPTPTRSRGRFQQ